MENTSRLFTGALIRKDTFTTIGKICKYERLGKHLIEMYPELEYVTAVQVGYHAYMQSVNILDAILKGDFENVYWGLSL